MFIEVNKKNLSDEVASQIINRIISGALLPGEKLPPEREVSEKMNVNRHTLREALRKLEVLGLLSARQGDGIYIKDYRDSGNLELLKHILYQNKDNNPGALKDILEIRRIISPEMAEKAALNRTEADIIAFQEILVSEKSTIEKDLAIHQAIARAGNNILYIFILNFFNDIFKDFGQLYFSIEENKKVSNKFHNDIAKAIIAGDSKSAKKIMNDVITYAEKKY
ncbi:MAG TPA: FadR/GntR family transcriptional regulator [Spirochaetota bacterium]|nr:FadR/GntR family transcriptional regulator [Spirochaetota bacterium]